MDNDKCIDCGEPEEDHHAFRGPVRPTGCRCESPEDFNDPENIPAVCAAFVPQGSGENETDDALCDTCEHERRCHARVAEGKGKR